MIEKKKPGFTLMEMIIVLALTVIVLSIASSMFTTGIKVFSDSDVKSTLQMEARDIQEELTSIGMQSIGVTDMKIDNLNCDDESYYIDKRYSELENIINEKKVSLSDRDKEPSIIYEITGYDKDSEYFKDESGTEMISSPPPYDIQFDGTSLSINGKTLTTHVKSFNVIPQDTNDSFANASSIEFNIVLHQEKGFSKLDYPINVKVTFRNKR